MTGVVFTHIKSVAAVVGNDGETAVVADECAGQEQIGGVAAITSAKDFWCFSSGRNLRCFAIAVAVFGLVVSF